jgi:two-component system, LytTR family, sensor kinase
VRTALVVVVLFAALALAWWAMHRQRLRRGFSTPAERVTFETLHEANAAAPALRTGLTEQAATRAVRHLRKLLGTQVLAVYDATRLLAWEGGGDRHADDGLAAVQRAMAAGRPEVLPASSLDCGDPECPVRGLVVVPLLVADRAVGGLAAVGEHTPPSAGLVRATMEIARWVSTQLELAELDTSRARLAQAEVKALRAQISPHFIYNALTTIASFVRTDPERARELILEFAEFTRYSFRSHGDFTTLAEELRSIDRYLILERARFGDRLEIRLQIAPEVLPIAVPFLALQPLVENAVRHGLAGKTGTGTITIVAQDAGTECLISVEDDGVGMDPAVLQRRTDDGEHVGLGNVDVRLRSVFGEAFGLVVETAPGAGTKVTLRIPKFHAGVRVS